MLFVGLFLLKLLLFDLAWCLPTTFTSFSYPTTYLTKLLVALLLTAPLTFGAPRTAARTTTLAAALLLDALLVANLLYFRTYYTAIPAGSYLLAGNLAGFGGSVAASLRPVDALFPLTTLAAWLAARRIPRTAADARLRRRHLLTTAATLLAIGGLAACGGGFRRSYAATLRHYPLSVTPTYSIFGTLLYEALSEKVRFTPELAAEVARFVEGRRQGPPPAVEAPRNAVVILLESFESWVLERSCGGVEITPCLNRLLGDARTLYAPHVLTQVRGGRSIDAQLLLTAGLLPLESGCFSSSHPRAVYPSLVEAFRTRRPGARAYAFTPDKEHTWNQMIVAERFGFDRLFSRKDFSRGITTGSGTHRRLADGPFFEESLARIDTLAPPDGGAFYLQLITYSGHGPFVIPEPLRRAEFPASLPETLRNYLTAANYTDAALGAFIDSLRRRPDFERTMIVITGDHEGLGTLRSALRQDPAGRDLVSEECFVPLVVLNAPVAGRREEVMGQIDLYPTLCDLLGIGDPAWPGLGHSLVRAGFPGAAVGPQGRLTGEELPPDAEERLRAAWSLSDRMIRSDYFSHAPAR